MCRHREKRWRRRASPPLGPEADETTPERRRGASEPREDARTDDSNRPVDRPAVELVVIGAPLGFGRHRIAAWLIVVDLVGCAKLGDWHATSCLFWDPHRRRTRAAGCGERARNPPRAGPMSKARASGIFRAHSSGSGCAARTRAASRRASPLRRLRRSGAHCLHVRKCQGGGSVPRIPVSG